MTSFLCEKLPCSHLKGVGSRITQHLQALGVATLADCLFHLPVDYEDRTRLTPIKACQEGQFAVVEGVISRLQPARGRRGALYCWVKDSTGELPLCFFHGSAALAQQLTPGDALRCYGQIRGWGPRLQMVHPEFERNPIETALPERLTAIYATRAGLSQRKWRAILHQCLLVMRQPYSLPDLIPDALRQAHNLWPLADALQCLHQPPAKTDLTQLRAGQHPAQRRLIVEELIAYQLGLRRLHQQGRVGTSARITDTAAITTAFCAQLPFELTTAQRRVLAEIQTDLCSGAPMLRLLQGDVGAGKTVVAALAMLWMRTVPAQAALMAPTELLAEQHFCTLQAWLAPLEVKVVNLTGRLDAPTRRATLAAIADGSAHVIVGTHALIQATVHFQALGLAVIDEQHRFGVKQRLALRQKGEAPHQLLMSATPIPRTLAMTMYADLDLSVLDQRPAGRQPVQTVVVSNARRLEVLDRVGAVCQQGQQAYWICPLIDESEYLQCEAAEHTFAALKEAMPSLRLGLLHGRLAADAKADAMRQFQAGNVDVLVATTVVEVGVDVPNATLMIIENPERLGLAQLHQLRGRVGRGCQASHCVLLYSPPLGELTRQRLKVMRDHHDGFVIADHDLRLRGAGDVLGTQQTGLVRLRVADLVRDQSLLPLVQRLAAEIARQHPDLIQPLIDRWFAGAEWHRRT